MSILITGGAGFIGSNLAHDYLESGVSGITLLDDLSSGKRSNYDYAPENFNHIDEGHVRLVEGDVADAALVRRLVMEADTIYHLAAIASVQICAQEPERAWRTNVAGTQAVFDAVAAAQRDTGRTIPVVYASSAAVYGDNPRLPLREATPPAPINRYGEHKLENERIAARAFAEHGVRSVGLRFFNVYGPRQDPASPYSGVISKFVEAARAERDLTIFGDGEQTRDFIYVGDVVRMLMHSADFAGMSSLSPHPSNGADIFNVCTGTATNLKLLARTIGTLLGKREMGLAFEPARAGDIRHSLGDPFYIMDTFNVMHWTPILLGLEKTLA